MKTNATIGHIYTLTDPFTELVRYVGQSVEVQKRISTHIFHANKGHKRTHKEKWLHSIVALGERPIVDIVWTGNYDELSKKEMEFIALFKSLGAKLTNATLGGTTTLGRKCSEETKKKFREMFTGKCLRPPITEKEKAALSLRTKGKPLSKKQVDGMKVQRRWGSDYWVNRPNAFATTQRFSELGRSKSKKLISIKDGVEVRYESTMDAQRKTGCNRRTIRQVAQGNYKQTKGYVFKFI